MKFPLLLGAILLALSIALGIAPVDRSDWALENALALLAVAVLVVSHRRFRLSNVSYALVFAMLVLHTVGAHYTYSKVPYDAWWRAVFGASLDAALGFERNHYDRLVHFAYGFLIAYPMRELFVRVADVKGFWGYFLPLDMVASTSMLYELVEWGAAEFFGGELGIAYLGSQGDVWDAQKDMALASLGAVLSLTLAAIVHRALDRDFQRQWAESLRVKRKRPLGEEEIARLSK
ncbi:MAG: DUF2238 domain-containing protein [Planctomycetota bacterium]|nr:MAG: DUF2238 domain-containing protein [Planctomycetota bacterium]